jgi:hypothetical protein
LRSRARTRWRSYSTYRPTAIGVRRATGLLPYTTIENGSK